MVCDIVIKLSNCPLSQNHVFLHELLMCTVYVMGEIWSWDIQYRCPSSIAIYRNRFAYEIILATWKSYFFSGVTLACLAHLFQNLFYYYSEWLCLLQTSVLRIYLNLGASRGTIPFSWQYFSIWVFDDRFSQHLMYVFDLHWDVSVRQEQVFQHFLPILCRVYIFSNC